MVMTNWLRGAAVLLFVVTVNHANSTTIELGPVDGFDLPPTDLTRVSVGQFAPDFVLTRSDGSRTGLSDFRDRKNVVLVFYRGHW